MAGSNTESRVVPTWGVQFLGKVFVVCLPYVLGCPYLSLLYGDCGVSLSVGGVLLDAATDEPIADTLLGGRSFTGGEQTHWIPPFTRWGDPNGPSSARDGTFDLRFSMLVSCKPPVEEFPRPDRVEVIVVREDCEFSFLIDINEDTVVDMTFPEDVIELKDPILVPACGPEEGP